MPINFNETESYDASVELILTSDANLGAVSASDIGVLNKGIQAVVNRTKYLKAKSGLFLQHSDQRIISSSGATIDPADVGKQVFLDVTNNLNISIGDTGGFEPFNIITLKCFGNSGKTAKISRSGTNKIKFEDGDRNDLYLMNNEYAVLMRMPTYWMILECSQNVYEVGMCVDGYATANNLIQRNGAVLNRADYARLWDWCSRKLVSGESLVTDTLWNSTQTILQETVTPYKGCFSSGNGSTTFRVPDDRGMFTRYLDQGRGVDNNRIWQYAGGYEHDYLKRHIHEVDITDTSNSQTGFGKPVAGGDGDEGDFPPYYSGYPLNNSTNKQSMYALENIVKNHAKLPLIRV